MKRLMSPKIIFLIVGMGLAVFALQKFAPDPDGYSSMRRSVATELPKYGYSDVDIGTLSDAQLAEIHTLLFSSRGTAEIRTLIRASLDKSSD